MSVKSELDALVAQALCNTIPVLPLRGADLLAREGGDLDYMVPAGRAVAACEKVADLAVAEGWYVATFRDIGYLAQVVLVRPGTQGSDNAVKIDFFDGLHWYGVGRDVGGQYLFESQASREEDVTKLAGVACFFQKILVVGRASERDLARVVATGVDARHLAMAGQSMLLPISDEQVRQRGVVGWDKWRLRAASGGCRGVVSGVAWLLRAVAAHIKFKSRWNTQAGLTIGVSGLDGSGKSTLVGRLLSNLHRAGGDPPVAMHLLPAWIPLPHRIIRRKATKENYMRPYAEPPVSSRLNGGARLSFYLCAFLLARISLWIGAKRGRLIVMDRSFLDFVSDLTRARIPAFRLPNWLIRALMPRGEFFYLDASPDAVVSRKGELSMEKATSLQFSYRRTSSVVGATLLDADREADAVFEDLLRHLSREYVRRIHALQLRS